MKIAKSMLTALPFALVSLAAAAQSTDTPSSNAPNAAKAEKAKDFATQQKAMQDASKSSASGTGATPPSSEAKKLNLSGKEMTEQMQSNQSFKGSKPVDKNAKAQAPVKPVKEMTPEERAKRRQEIAKEAKP